MHDARRSLQTGFAGWKPLARSAAIAVVVLSVVLPAGSVFGGVTASAHPAPTVSVGQLQLDRATQSLALSQGPSRAYGGCRVQADAQVSCGIAASPHPLANGTVAPKSWTDLTTFVGSGPAPRWLGGMTYDPIDHYVLLFGGDDVTAGLYSDTWTFANDTWTLLSPNSYPIGRYAFGLTWDYTDKYAVLFGGYSTAAGTPAYNDTWTFVHGQWTNATPATLTSTDNPASRWR